MVHQGLFSINLMMQKPVETILLPVFYNSRKPLICLCQYAGHLKVDSKLHFWLPPTQTIYTYCSLESSAQSASEFPGVASLLAGRTC
jgi:hypothetical protein